MEIKENEWEEIINYTHSLKRKVWLDIFDEYGLLILKKNFKKIYGIKIQSSVLKNHILLEKLSFLKDKKKKIIINFSGFNLNEIQEILKNNLIFQNKKKI